MRKAVITILGLLFAAVVYAGTSSLTYTAGQSTAIQNQLIPRYNAEHCSRYGLPTTCSSAELVSAGCSAAANTFKTIVTDSCVIFPSTAPGEEAFLKEVANIGLVTVFNRLTRHEADSYAAAKCAQWKAMNATQQQNECTAAGLPSTCSACQ